MKEMPHDFREGKSPRDPKLREVSLDAFPPESLKIDTIAAMAEGRAALGGREPGTGCRRRGPRADRGAASAPPRGRGGARPPSRSSTGKPLATRSAWRGRS